jgi:DNA replication protein DnaC
VISLKPCEVSGYAVVKAGGSAKASVAQPVSSCSECNGTGLMRTQRKDNGRIYDVSAPCPRARMEARVKLFNQANIPAVHASSNFDNYRPSTAGQNKALSTAKSFVFSPTRTRGFMLSGPVGTGKTHLLAAALTHLTLEAGISAHYVELSLLYAQIRSGFQQGKSGGEIIQPLSHIDVLAIDELGKGRGSVFELETLEELISRRYNAQKITLFATNYSLKPPEEKARSFSSGDLAASTLESKILCERVGERIYSRLCEMCEFVEIENSALDMRRMRHQTTSGHGA